ncbi:4-alpha-glucanotransferase, partial [Desulfovibrio desulfuricans]|nr:4-alpha-glucanotransferase [Desulfovibrio desulfuricans]
MRDAETLAGFKALHGEDLMFYQFLQYEFMEQWMRLKAFANERGIQIIGDIPIYVAFDSADSWANPE